MVSLFWTFLGFLAVVVHGGCAISTSLDGHPVPSGFLDDGGAGVNPHLLVPTLVREDSRRQSILVGGRLVPWNRKGGGALLSIPLLGGGWFDKADGDAGRSCVFGSRSEWWSYVMEGSFSNGGGGASRSGLGRLPFQEISSSDVGWVSSGGAGRGGWFGSLVAKTDFASGGSGSVDGGSPFVVSLCGGGGGRIDNDGGGLMAGSDIKVGVGGFDIAGWDLGRRVLRRALGVGQVDMIGSYDGGWAAGCPDGILSGIGGAGRIPSGGSAGAEAVMPVWRDWVLGCCLWFWAFLVFDFLF
ncbi:uncharacterized protein LOC133744800 [Rosa rugosa]|uniref:uncharacterized protein LOC133744800 n=1 Tax=Rosa rugosa TaxID=74645 RepID=UPI002B408521|nr:uncharacterized protein LOC133744800 [Rosa rugosa]